MRTNIEIDEKLLKAAMKAAGTTTKRETVEQGLKALVRRRNLLRILDLRGTIAWDGDLEAMRLDR